MSLLLALVAAAPDPPEPDTPTGGGHRLFTPAAQVITDDEFDALLVALLLAA